MGGLTESSDGCFIVRKLTYCPNNYTILWYDGVPQDRTTCDLDECSLLLSNWGYLPNKPANTFFIILFALIFAANIPLGIWKKTWGVLIGMTIGAALEAAGYAGRVLANTQPFAFNPFLIYIIFLTIAPAFLSAAIYMCLSRIIVVYGQSNARFKPRIYSIVFMFSDFVALVLQGAGGGIATVYSGKDANKSQSGINTMIAGLAWQVISLTIFAVASADFAWCVKQKRGVPNPQLNHLRRSKKFRLFLWSLGIQTTVIYIRSIYRVAELTEGFTGTIANLEVPYMIFEPTMIIIACLCMTLLHPSFVFGDAWQAADFRKAQNQEQGGSFKNYDSEMEPMTGYQGQHSVPEKSGLRSTTRPVEISNPRSQHGYQPVEQSPARPAQPAQALGGPQTGLREYKPTRQQQYQQAAQQPQEQQNQQYYEGTREKRSGSGARGANTQTMGSSQLRDYMNQQGERYA